MIDDLRILRGFVAVAEELNFRKAAERLHMSQPPLSRMISGLEDQLGAVLFLRNTRTVELTREGKLFLAEAMAVLDSAAAAGRRIRHAFASGKRPLLIGATSSAYFTGFPEMVSRFRKEHPELAVETVSMNSADQIEALASGKLDAGFLLPPVFHDELRTVPFGSVRMRLAIPDTHALAGEPEPLALEKFRHDIFILHQREKDPGMYEGILRCCTQAGFRPKVRVKKDDEPCMGLVTSGAGIHFSAAAQSCIQMAGVRLVDLAGEAPSLETSLAWRKSDPSAALRRFLEIAAPAAAKS